MTYVYIYVWHTYSPMYDIYIHLCMTYIYIYIYTHIHIHLCMTYIYIFVWHTYTSLYDIHIHLCMAYTYIYVWHTYTSMYVDNPCSPARFQQVCHRVTVLKVIGWDLNTQERKRTNPATRAKHMDSPCVCVACETHGLHMTGWLRVAGIWPHKCVLAVCCCSIAHLCSHMTGWLRVAGFILVGVSECMCFTWVARESPCVLT